MAFIVGVTVLSYFTNEGSDQFKALLDKIPGQESNNTAQSLSNVRGINSDIAALIPTFPTVEHPVNPPSAFTPAQDK